jgi:hypothetical protein
MPTGLHKAVVKRPVFEKDLQYHPGKPVTASNLTRDAADTAEEAMFNPLEAVERGKRRMHSYLERGGANINTPVEDDPAIRQRRKRATNFPEP